MSPSSLSQIVLVRQHVTLLQGTPSLVRRVTAGPLGGARLLGPHSNLRVLALGGESFPSLEEVCRWGGEESDTQVFNVYGITEVSSWACCHHVQVLAEHGAPMDWNEKALGRGAVPIGDPLPGTRVELRTEEGPLEGCGRGEIWIGKDVGGMARYGSGWGEIWIGKDVGVAWYGSGWGEIWIGKDGLTSGNSVMVLACMSMWYVCVCV